MNMGKLSDEKLLSLVDHEAIEKFKERALNIGSNKTFGTFTLICLDLNSFLLI